MLLIESPVAKFNKADLYIVMIMKMVDEAQLVKICDRELQAFTWLDPADLPNV